MALCSIRIPFQRILLLALGLSAQLWSTPCAAATYQPVHVAFLTDCSKYSNWQSLAMIYSFKMSGQPGKLTRVMCCSEQDVKNYPKSILDEVETHIAPSYSVHPVTHDAYAAYNKPEAVIDWLEKVTPEEEYVLVLDSDMILRRPFLVEEMQPAPGLAIGNRYSYMIGVVNDLAMRHVPQVKPRNDSLAGPYGRRGDQVGGFFFIHRDDLKRMSHGWLKYTEDVRADPLAYKDSGDMYAVNPGDKPWISEMYGYSFGASTADVWHKWDTTSMLYPYGAYDHGSKGPNTMPKLMHYGLLAEINAYKFDKHWFYELDVTQCPPWDTKPFQKQSKRSGLFDHPPRISEIKEKNFLPTYYRDLLVIETVATMNAAFCDFHLRHCQPSQQLYDECKKAFDIYTEAAEEARRVEVKLSCSDGHEKCEVWAKAGECEKNQEYMEDTCKKACKKCVEKKADASLKPLGSDLGKNLEALERKLKESTSQTEVAPKPSPDPSPAVPNPSPMAVVVVEEKVSHQGLNTVVATPSPQVRDELVLPVASPRMPSAKPRRELIVRCYRMQLDLEEVKACVKDAKDGYEYVRVRPAQQRVLSEDTLDDISEQSEGTGSVLESSLHAQQATTTTSSLSSSGNASGEVGPTTAVGSWQLLALGGLVVAAAAAMLPRLFRRRAKSGMRLD